jgi:hypothetical protein
MEPWFTVHKEAHCQAPLTRFRWRLIIITQRNYNGCPAIQSLPHPTLAARQSRAVLLCFVNHRSVIFAPWMSMRERVESN